MIYFTFLLKKFYPTLGFCITIAIVFNYMFLLYFFYFVLKFPPLLGSCILRYHCSHIFYFMFLLNSHLRPDLESYITSMFIVIYFVFLLTLNSYHDPNFGSQITTVVKSFILSFYFNSTSTQLLSHTLPLYLQSFTLSFC